MQLQINAHVGGASSQIDVADSAFGRKFNEGLVHQVVTAYMAGGRAGTKAQKTRSEVSGGGAKPFRQKGTGRARAGTSRSPLWRSGGVTFAAKPRSYKQKVNRKMYRAAMAAIFSELVRQERLLVMDQFQVEAVKTKTLAKKLQEMDLVNVLIITDGKDTNLMLSARNIPHVDVIDVIDVDPVSLIGHEKVLITVDALKKVEEKLA